MTRVMLIGNARGGKSAISWSLSSVYALPYYAIDKILWQCGWKQIISEEYERTHEFLITGDRWLVGGYGSSTGQEG